MSENAARQRNVEGKGRDGAGIGESRTTQIMQDKKAYKYVTAPKSWKLACKYGVPAVAGILFIIAVITGYYDYKTWIGMWLWFFRMIKAIFVWEDY